MIINHTLNKNLPSAEYYVILMSVWMLYHQIERTKETAINYPFASSAYEDITHIRSTLGKHHTQFNWLNQVVYVAYGNDVRSVDTDTPCSIVLALAVQHADALMDLLIDVVAYIWINLNEYMATVMCSSTGRRYMDASASGNDELIGRCWDGKTFVLK